MNNPGVTDPEPRLTPPPENPDGTRRSENQQGPVGDLPPSVTDALGDFVKVSTQEEDLDGFKERILDPYKGYETAHNAVQTLLKGIPEQELGILKTAGLLDKILEYCPSQEFRHRNEWNLLWAYTTGQRVSGSIPERWKDRTNHYLKNIHRGQPTNPGLEVTEVLLSITAARNGKDPQQLLGTSLDSLGYMARSNAIHRTKYASEVVSLAQVVPANSEDAFPWTMSPQKQLRYVQFNDSSTFDDTIPLIKDTIDTSSASGPDLGALQEVIQRQDPQFEGPTGMDRLKAVIGAIKIHGEVFNQKQEIDT